MKIIVCVDDRGGMMFNNRRQSRDSAVISDVLSLTEGARLLITPYSAKMFSSENCITVTDPLAEAQKGDFCFVEDSDMSPYVDSVDTVVLYRWNKKYPYDKQLTLDMTDFKLTSSTDFVGTSHDKITREIYKK